MKSIDITIQDKEGLHARPAGILSKAAKGFESKVTMTKNGKVADMKKIFAVMGLKIHENDHKYSRYDDALFHLAERLICLCALRRR